MNIKISLKLSATLEHILAFLTVSFVILFTGFLVNIILSFFESILFSSSNLFSLILPYFIIVYCNFLVVFFTYNVVSTSNDKTNQYLKTTKQEKIILIRLFSKNNHPSKLNLELQKISKAVENKSSLYQELNETDFPYLNKLFRRFNKGSIINENMSTAQKDISKLNPHHFDNPKLLTVNHVDEELNNLINNQFVNLNVQKNMDCAKMK